VTQSKQWRRKAKEESPKCNTHTHKHTHNTLHTHATYTTHTTYIHTIHTTHHMHIHTHITHIPHTPHIHIHHIPHTCIIHTSYTHHTPIYIHIIHKGSGLKNFKTSRETFGPLWVHDRRLYLENVVGTPVSLHELR